MEVARLEAVFTGDDSNFDVVADRVEARQKDLDGQTATTHVDADAAAAFDALSEVLADLADVDSAEARAKVQADVDDAQRELEEVSEALEGVDQTPAVAQVKADVDEVLDDLDKTERALGDLDDEVARPRIDPEGLEEFRDEAGGTAREAAASFDGSAESIGEVFQEVAANAFAGFGPAGAIAGVAAAAGLGIALAKLTEISEATNAAAEEGAEWSQSFNAADQTGRLEALRGAWSELAAEVRDTREVYEVWQDRAVTAIEQIAAATDIAGDDVARFMGAFEETDPTRRLQELEGALESVRVKQEEANQANYAAAEAWDRDTALREGEKRDRLSELGDIIEEEAAKQEAANEIERANAEALGLSVEAYRDHVAAQERSTEALTAYGEALEGIADPAGVYDRILADKEEAERRTAEATAKATDDASDSWEDYARDVKVTTQDLIDDWIRQAREAEEFEDNLAIIGRNGGQELADELRSKGPEVAGSVAAVIAKSSPREQQRAINAHARATGREISGAMADGITDDGWRLQRAANGVIQAVRPGDIPVELSVAWDPSQLDDVLDNIQRNASSRSIFVGTTVTQAQANGGVVDYFANGAEHHVAQIAPAGAWRVWAEPETGGEAYIPLAPSKRQRSMEILEQTAARFGAQVVPQADGAVVTTTPQPAAGLAPVQVTVWAMTPDADPIAAAVSDELAWALRS